MLCNTEKSPLAVQMQECDDGSLLLRIFRGATKLDRISILEELAQVLRQSRDAREREVGDLLLNVLRGVRELKDRNIFDFITPLCRAAALYPHRILR